MTNSARWALGLESWNGDATSKLRLCGLPISGDHLFGPELDSILELTADKKKSVPDVKKKSASKQFFRGVQKGGVSPRARKSCDRARRVGGKGMSFLTLLQPPTIPSDLLAAG